MKTYTEKEVEKLLETQRGNCYVAVYNATQDQSLSQIASSAPEPGQWRKSGRDNESLKQLINQAYENYSEEYEKDNSVGLSLLVHRVDGSRSYRKPDIEMFEAMCTHDKNFSEKWGLKIEERGLSLEERFKLQMEKVPYSGPLNFEEQYIKDVCDKNNIPTRAITVTYNNETIEVYE